MINRLLIVPLYHISEKCLLTLSISPSALVTAPARLNRPLTWNVSVLYFPALFSTRTTSIVATSRPHTEHITYNRMLKQPRTIRENMIVSKLFTNSHTRCISLSKVVTNTSDRRSCKFCYLYLRNWFLVLNCNACFSPMRWTRTEISPALRFVWDFNPNTELSDVCRSAPPTPSLSDTGHQHKETSPLAAFYKRATHLFLIRIEYESVQLGCWWNK